MPRGWRDGIGLAVIVIHACAAVRTDRAVGPGAGGDVVGVDGKAGGDGVRCRDTAEWIAGDRADRTAVYQDIGHVITRGRRDGVALAIAMVHARAAVRTDRAVGPGAGGDIVGVDGKAGTDGVGRSDQAEGVAAAADHARVVHPVHQHLVNVITRDGRDGVSLTATGVDVRDTIGTDRAVGSGACGDGEGRRQGIHRYRGWCGSRGEPVYRHRARVGA